MNGDIHSIALVTSISAFLVVGITGTLIDAPRVMFLFYMIAFSAYFQSERFVEM